MNLKCFDSENGLPNKPKPCWRTVHGLGFGVLFLSLLISSRAFALDPAKSLFQYNCRSWTRQSGLPANGINAIAQTKDGYLWLATVAGPVRFDGINFELIDLGKAKKLRATEATSLSASKTGGLWIGINNGGVASIVDGKNVSRLDGAAFEGMSRTIMSLVESTDGDLFVAATGQAGRVKGDKTYETLLPPPGTNTAYDVLTACQDSQGRVWFGTMKAGLYFWQAGVLTKFPDPALDDTTINAVAVDSQGVINVATINGLMRYNSRFQKLPGLLQTGEIRSLLVDRHGVLWVGTIGNGLARCRDDVVTQFRKNDGLADNFVTALAEDQEGNLWVGTRNGLSQISDIKIPTFGKAEGLTADVDISVTSSRRGGIWVATSFGLTHFNGGTDLQNFSQDTGPGSTWISLLLEAKNGDVYMTDGGMAIQVLSGGKIVARYPNKDYPSALGEDAQGVIAAVSGKLYRVNTNSMSPYLLSDGQQASTSYPYDMVTGKDGSIWIADASLGIVRLKDGSLTNWMLGTGADAPKVLTVYEDKDGALWVGSTMGIARLKNGQLRMITKSDGLFEDVVPGLVLDDHDRFWAEGVHSIFSVTRRALNDFADGKTNHVDCMVYNSLSAVKSVERNKQKMSGCKSLDGRIWFPTAQGVVMIDPTNIAVNPVPPQVHIDVVRVNGRESARTGTVVVPPGKGELEFQYVGLSFVAPESVQYRYKLDGYDKDWVAAGNRRFAFYTNLKPGPYKFHVLAANADGVWNETGDSVDLELRPHFYQTIWCYLFYAGLALGAFAGVFTWRMSYLKGKQRALQAANDLLEQRVEARTKELAYERDLFRSLLDNASDRIYFKDVSSKFIRCSKSKWIRTGASESEIIGKTDFDLFQEAHARPAFEDEQQIIRTGQPLVGKLEKEVHPDGLTTWVLTTKMPWRDSKGNIIGTFGISKDITGIKEAEMKLEAVHRQLVDASRAAGMAEVATSVLHNVGNVLNSVNVSAILILDTLRKSKLSNVSRLAAMIHEHRDHLGAFFTTDPRGRELPGYLSRLAEHLTGEQAELLKEVEQTRNHIEHIKDIVAMQQSYAKISGVVEKVMAVDLVEDALRMNGSALARHDVEVIRDFPAQTIEINVERQKVLQVLVNLIRNAKYACDDGGRKDKRMTIQVRSADGLVQLAVKDNGVGIPAENMTLIFNHGFTTREKGHGFGLHSGALAAKEMGGTLNAHSDGPGQGATFTLELPLQPPSKL